MDPPGPELARPEVLRDGRGHHRQRLARAAVLRHHHPGRAGGDPQGALRGGRGRRRRRRGARFWHVTLPLLKPVLAIVVLFSTIFTFSDFNIVYVLTHGGPINSTHLFATLARQIGLESGRIGEGAAISLYLFPVLVFVVWVQLRFVRKQAY